jgi:hypothetical protein
MSGGAADFTHGLAKGAWNRPGLTPALAQAAWDSGAADPDTGGRRGGPIETVLNLKRPDRAVACHWAAQAWRRAHGRTTGEEAARVMATRLVRLGAFAYAHDCAALFEQGEPGPIGRLHPALVSDVARAGTQRLMLELLRRKSAAPFRQHEGDLGVPDVWRAMFWFKAPLTEVQDFSFRTAFRRTWIAWLQEQPPETVYAQAQTLYRNLARQWANEDRGAAPGPWLMGLVSLMDVTLATDGPTAYDRLLREVPELALGFGQWRAEGLPPESASAVMRLSTTADYLALLESRIGAGDALDLAQWRSDVWPEAPNQQDIANRWQRLLERHPTWVAEYPLPAAGVATFAQHPTLMASLIRGQILAAGSFPLRARARSGPRRA